MKKQSFIRFWSFGHRTHQSSTNTRSRGQSRVEAAAMSALEPLEQRLFLSVTTEPKFMIGAWQQKTTSFADWSARHVNTMVEQPQCSASGNTSVDDWTSAADAQGLWVVRPPRRKGTYANPPSSDTTLNWEDTCKDVMPGVTAAIEPRLNGVATTPANGGTRTPASWVDLSTIYDPQGDVQAHPNILGFAQMDEPNGKYTRWFLDSGTDGNRWGDASNGFGFRELQTQPGYSGTYPTGKGPSTGIPFYSDDYVRWMNALYDYWKSFPETANKDVFLNLQGDKMDAKDNELYGFYSDLGQDITGDGVPDRAEAADALGEDFYPINWRGGNSFPVYDAATGGNQISDGHGGFYSVGDAWMDLALKGKAYSNGALVNPLTSTSGTKFEAIRQGNPGVTDSAGRTWNGYDHSPDFDQQRNFAVIEIYWQKELSLPGRVPTLPEVRGEIWDAILRGANGIVYFPGAGGDNTNNLGDANATPPKPAQAAVGLSNELTTQDIRMETFADVLMSTQRENAGGGKVPFESAVPTLQAAWRKSGTTEYFLVENMTHNAANSAKFKLVGVAANTVVNVNRTDGTTGTVTVGADGYITDSFAGYDTNIYYTGTITDPPIVTGEKKIEAENFGQPNTSVTVVSAATPSGQAIDDIANDDFTRYDNVNFDDGTYTNFTINAAVDPSRNNLGHVEVWLDSRTTAGGGTKIGEVTFTSTGNWTTFQERTSSLTSTPTGTHTLFLLFKGSVTRLAILDYFKFTGTAAPTTNRDAKLPIQAESRDITNTTTIDPTGNYVDDIGNDDFLQFKGVNFGAGDLNKLHATLAVDAGHAGGTMEIWVNARSDIAGGTQIGVLPITSTASYTTFVDETVDLTNTLINDVHDVYLLFKGGNSRLALLDSFKFTSDTATETANNIQAETFTQPSTSVTIVPASTPSGQAVDDITNDDFVRYDNVDFTGTNFTQFVANVAVDPSRNLNGHIEVWLDSRSTAGGGTKIGDLNTASTGAWTTFTEQQTNLSSTPTGNRTVFLLFKGTVDRLMILDYFRFQ